MPDLALKLLSEAIAKGADYLERGVTDFSKWSRAMEHNFGEPIRPHLERIWTSAQEGRHTRHIAPPQFPLNDQRSTTSAQTSPQRRRFRNSAVGVGAVMVMVLGLAAVWVGCDRAPAPNPAETTEAASQPPYAQESDPDRILLAQLGAKAVQGDAQSQCELGQAFFYGNLGLATDAVESVKWYRKAAEQNDAEAQFRLGYSYSEGRGVAKDEAEAVKWWRKAAEQNHAEAQFNLGVCYSNGKGVPKDAVEAVKWYRKAAEQNDAVAQFNLGGFYSKGEGVPKDAVEAVKWYRKAAEQNNAEAQCNLGYCYSKGEGVPKDAVEAVKWFRKAAEQGVAHAQNNLAVAYEKGQGVPKDYVESAKWYRKAAEQNFAAAQFSLGVSYANGQGVPQDYVEAYKWFNLAAAQGISTAIQNRDELVRFMTPEQIAEAQRLSREFRPHKATAPDDSDSSNRIKDSNPTASGTGFFITDDGYLITNEHVAGNGSLVRLVTSAGLISAKVIKVDAANDLALLKADGTFAALPVVASRSVRLGATVATVGFPNIGLQGFAPKLAKGEVAALSGAQDDVHYFQISVPVQPGNSGGALVDERGNVVGVVAAKLSMQAALATSGALPENVNYAVKSSLLLSLLESVPDVSANLKESNTKERKFEDVVKDAERAAVLVLVY